MSPFTVGDYLAERIASLDIRHNFIVPGDYNLILLDKLEAHPSLTEIGCKNELNCSLAAEGYARGHGVGLCIVTYSVGAFSALNGIGSAYAENLPVILISGSPNTNDVSEHILHHTLGEYDTTYQLEMAKASELIGSKQKCVILVGPKVRRAMAQDALRQFAEAVGCAVIVQPAAKGAFPEDHDQFAGIFWGQVSTLAADTIANWADLIICVGTVFTDYSTVGWTALPSVAQLLVDMESVTVGSKIYCIHIRMSEFLCRLAEAVCWNDNTMVEYNRLRPDSTLGEPSCSPEKLTRKEIARQTQVLINLNPQTVIFADTGDSWFNDLKLNLPFGADFEIEMQ